MSADIAELKGTLLTQSGQLQIEALKQIKNSTIGYLELKEVVAKDDEILDAILKILESGPYEGQLQAAYIVGSLAHGNGPTHRSLMKHQAPQLIIKTLRKSASTELSTACFRAFVTLLKIKPNIPLHSCHADLFVILKTLISDKNTPLSVLNHCCQIIEGLGGSSGSSAHLEGLTVYLTSRIAALLNSGSKNSVLYLHTVSSSLSALTQVISRKQALDLLSTKYEITFNSTTIKAPQFLEEIINCTRLNSNEVRIHAAELLAKLDKYCLDVDDLYHEKLHEKLVRPILPTIIPIFNQTPEDARIMRILGSVCVSEKKCAQIAVETGLINKMVGLLKSHIYSNTPESNELAEGYLLALAAIALQTDEYRMKEVSSGILPILLSIISSKEPGEHDSADNEDEPFEIVNSIKVKVAACHVLQALSRSIKLLRTSLGTLDVVDGLKALLVGDSCTTDGNNMDLDSDGNTEHIQEEVLEDEQEEAFDQEDTASIGVQFEAQTAVMATICNLIIEFSPLHKDILDKGILDIIIDYCRSPHPPLRLNSIWALKNVIYEAVRPVKDTVLQKLTWPFLVELVDDVEPEIQEQALEFIRNALCRNSSATNKILTDYSEGPLNLLNIIERKLVLSSEENNPGILVAALYILVHIAAGEEPHRTLIVEHGGLLNLLLKFTVSRDVNIRTACVWLLINLTYVDDTGNFPLHGPFKARAQKLVSLGFEEKLEQLIHDPILDVRERGKTALTQLHNLVH